MNLPIAEYFRPRCVTRPAVNQLIAVLCYKYRLAMAAMAACWGSSGGAMSVKVPVFFTSVILFCGNLLPSMLLAESLCLVN